MQCLFGERERSNCALHYYKPTVLDKNFKPTVWIDCLSLLAASKALEQFRKPGAVGSNM